MNLIIEVKFRAAGIDFGKAKRTVPLRHLIEFIAGLSPLLSKAMVESALVFHHGKVIFDGKGVKLSVGS